MDAKSKGFDYLESHKMEMAEFLSNLVQIDSINHGVEGSANEKEAQEYVFSYMNDMGLEVQRIVVNKNDNRPNMIGVYKGKGGGKNILINAHIDTVPVFKPKEWKYPPLGGKIENGIVHGRGAADDKMGIACALFAVKALQETNIKLNGDVIIQSSVGEESNEGGILGAGPATKLGPKASFAIVCECSNMEILIESCCLFYFEVIIKGKAVHSCARNQVMFPQSYNVPCGEKVGVDALYKALPIIDMFYRKERNWSLNSEEKVIGAGGRPYHDSQGVGVFNINPVKIEGGTYLGSIPGEVKITYSVWHPKSAKKEDLFKEIKESIYAISSTDSWLKDNPPEIRMPILQLWDGFKTDVNEPGVIDLKKAYKDALGYEPIITGFKAVCDATYINEQGVPSVILGPGDLNNGIHGTDEFVSIDEMLRAAKVYASMMIEWCE